jgi:hypothetical protein
VAVGSREFIMSHNVQIAMVEIWKVSNSLEKNIPELKENVFKHAGELMTSVWIFMGAATFLLLLLYPLIS